MTDTNPLGATRVIVGVDTHGDEHVAVAIDWLGARLGQCWLPAASGGYEGLHCWVSGLGEVALPSESKVRALTEPDWLDTSPDVAAPSSRSTGLTGLHAADWVGATL